MVKKEENVIYMRIVFLYRQPYDIMLQVGLKAAAPPLSA